MIIVVVFFIFFITTTIEEGGDGSCRRLILHCNIIKKEGDGILLGFRGGSLPFFSCFHFWDGMFLFPSPLHVPTMLNSPHSYNVELSTFLKPCVAKFYGAEARKLY